MLGVDAVGQRQGVDRLAVQRQLAAVKIGFLLRGTDAADVVVRRFARQRRERVEGQRLIAIINLRHQILPEEIGVGVLQVDQVTFSARNSIRIQVAAVISFGAAGHRGEILPQEQAVVAVGLAFVILGGQLQLLVIVDINGAGTHHVEAIGILQASLGIVDQDFIALAVVPAAVALVRDRQAAPRHYRCRR
ncbi:Uncharacterised protein [Providencia rustigianii]|nr:Uncharacterised protein [Providencia rustigianii]